MRQRKSGGLGHKTAISEAFLSFRIGVLLWEPDARFEELLEFLDRHRTAADEVAFFTSPIHPVLPLDVIERRAGILKKRIAAARKAGFRAGINFLSTIGHCDEYLHLALHGPYAPIVGLDGARAGGSFCPNGENLREYVRQSYAMMAQAAPEFIWLDDDLRIDNHRPANRGCCCETCLRLFADAVGRSFTREELRAAFDAGTPAEKLALRRAWIAHNARSLARLLALIEQTVHTINPAIALGLMTGEYFYDGYDFTTRADVLAGPPKTPVKWRPGGGSGKRSRPVRVNPASRKYGRGGSARLAPKRGASAAAGPRPRASGRDGPEHPAAVPEVPRHCPPLRTTANGRILAPPRHHLPLRIYPHSSKKFQVSCFMCQGRQAG
ncbi:MAG: hypothetical protein A3K19_08045 [Lentisphaerae bacterium RIFOXYB12_FULL_65_16]|nr:MAG: hypothetical protein A3K18_23815 [Lentisphaerae bacterium RIFOXYA12_64_32]OGV91190.1 MAG: hypothetical protein A3K19_08045 [Lentisphaerae bacterium RIFOXYB12_FULL_65_16]